MNKMGRVSAMQHFSTGDGDGIRTTVFMQGCNLSCEWCHNPETISEKGELLFYESRCTGCRDCEKACPTGVHSFEAGHSLDRKKCILCGACADECVRQALSVSGIERTVDEVYDFIAEDIEYYEASGGGVTFSGGEPLLQADFVGEVAKKCKENGISVYIDTALCVPYQSIEKVIDFTDKFLIDLKAATNEDYREKTGGNLDLVVENIKKISAAKKDILVRIPIIPAHNDTLEYQEKCAKILSECNVEEVELLPFHRLGTSKYQALELDYKYKDTPAYEKKKLNELKKIFNNKGENEL